MNYQEQEARDCLDLSRRVPFCNKAQVCKHHSYYHSHGCGTDQENLPVLELFGWSKFKYECVVYSCLSPQEDVAAVEEQVQEQEAEHTAINPCSVVVN